MYLFSRRLRSLATFLGATLLLPHCGGDGLSLPGEISASRIEKVDGDNQGGPPGSPLPDSLVVKVVDSQDDPVADQRVAFVLEDDPPGASVSPDQPRTNSEGVAKTRWTLGSTSGVQAVAARVVGAEGLEVRFQAAVDPGDPAGLAAVSGDGQSSVAGSPLPSPLVVKVTDQFGNPVPNISVNWDAEDGSIDPSSSETGADGLAQASWVLGSSTGAQTATASSGDLQGSQVTFRATATPGSAARLLRVSGNDQSGLAGQELDQPLVVRLVDQAGNGIADRPVAWIIGSGGGSVNSSTSRTDGDGEASTRWTLGSSPGTNTLNAVVSGVGVVGFIATGRSAGGGGGGGGGGGAGGSSPNRMEFRVQPSEAERDRRISPPVEVEVLDQNGDRFTGGAIEVKLELLGDDGELKGRDREQTQSGVASFDDLKVDKEGDYRLRASADGLPSVESNQFHIRRRDRGGKDD